MKLQLPDAVALFFRIGNHAEYALLPEAFAEQAHVFDEKQNHRGIPAIRAWLSTAHDKYDYTSTPVAMTREGDALVVASRVEGNFPGSPVTLHYRFELHDGKIASLEIG